MRKHLFVLGVVIFLCCCSLLQATIITIDDFESGSIDLRPTALTVPIIQNETGLAGVYGGTRTIEYTVFGKSLSGAGVEMAESLLIDNNGKRNWSTVELTYDAGGAGLNLDLSSFTIISMDAWFEHVAFDKDTVVTLTLSDGTNTASVTKTWDVEQCDLDLTLYFSLSGFAGVDKSNIQSLTVYIESDWYGEYAIDNIQVSDHDVPEPATIAIFLLGGLAIRLKKA